MRSRPRTIALCSLILVVSQGYAQGEDPIGDRLQAAKESYSEGAAKASQVMLDTFDRAIEDIAKTGDLDAVVELRDARKLFEDSGKLPEKPTALKLAAIQYTQKAKQLRIAMGEAYQEAVESFTKDLQVERAQMVRAAAAEFMNAPEVLPNPSGAPEPVSEVNQLPPGKRDSQEHKYVDAARARYEKELLDARRAYDAAMQKAQGRFFEAYDTAIVGAALKRGDGEGLDIANSLNAEKKALLESKVVGEVKAPSKHAQLEAVVTTGAWTWANTDRLKFNPDGTANLAINSNIRITWTAIDGNRIVLFNESKNLVSLMIFNPEYTSFQHLEIGRPSPGTWKGGVRAK